MQREEIKPRISSLLKEMGKGSFEREEAIALSLLSALSGESIFLLGLPGVGKSMIARRLKMAFKDSTCFEYLMSRFSTPDEIFGPVSIGKLKDEDKYERVVEGYLPTADVVFLDEIWKAGPAIQNSLLTAINEKIFHNGDKDIDLPIKGIIAASNELPAEGEGLEALWDRFLIRYVVRPIKKDAAFMELIAGKPVSCFVPDVLKLSKEEYEQIQEMKEAIMIPNDVLAVIIGLRTKYITEKAKQDSEENTDEETKDVPVPYVSDRRWKKIAGILKTSALLNGRNSVNLSDCLLLEHLIWDTDQHIEDVVNDISTVVSKGIVQAMTGALKTSKTYISQGDKILYSPDEGVHYVIETGSGQMKISVEDYTRLSGAATYGRFVNGNEIVLCSGNGDFIIKTTKPGTITINNFTYPLKTVNKVETSITPDVINLSPEDVLVEFYASVENNMFLRTIKEYKVLSDNLAKLKPSKKQYGR